MTENERLWLDEEPHQIGRFYNGEAAGFCGLWCEMRRLWVSDYVDATTYASADLAQQAAQDLNDYFAAKGKPYRAVAIPKG